MVPSKSGFGVSAFVILFMTFFVVYTNGEYEHMFNNVNDLCVGTNCPDRSGNGISGAMWFGPRLGRRRRSGGVSANHGDMENLIDADTGTWSDGFQKDEKRHSTQFTPRLGRELSDEYLQRIIGIDNDDNFIHLLNNKSPGIDFHHQLMQSPLPSQFRPRSNRRQIYIPSSKLDDRLQEYVQNL